MIEKTHTHIGHRDVYWNDDCPVCKGICDCYDCKASRRYWNGSIICPECHLNVKRKDLKYDGRVGRYGSYLCPKCGYYLTQLMG